MPKLGLTLTANSKLNVTPRLQLERTPNPELLTLNPTLERAPKIELASELGQTLEAKASARSTTPRAKAKATAKARVEAKPSARANSNVTADGKA